MDGNVDEVSFEDFKDRLKQSFSAMAQERDKRAFELPDILNDPEYILYLTIEYNFTDRVN